MPKAVIDVEILEDGTIKVKTGNLQGEHHVSADKLLDLIHELAGGERKTESTRTHHHHHAHEHGHHHQH